MMSASRSQENPLPHGVTLTPAEVQMASAEAEYEDTDVSQWMGCDTGITSQSPRGTLAVTAAVAGGNGASLEPTHPEAVNPKGGVHSSSPGAPAIADHPQAQPLNQQQQVMGGQAQQQLCQD